MMTESLEDSLRVVRENPSRTPEIARQQSQDLRMNENPKSVPPPTSKPGDRVQKHKQAAIRNPHPTQTQQWKPKPKEGEYLALATMATSNYKLKVQFALDPEQSFREQ